MITKVNETKTLLKHISCDFKCKLESKNVLQIKKWSKDKFQCECKNQIKHCICKQKKKKKSPDTYTWSPNTYTCVIKKYIKAILI